MTDNKTGTRTVESSAEAGDGERGWYLYGITRRDPLAAVLAESADEMNGSVNAENGRSDVAPLQLLEWSGLVAVVRPVRLDDFSHDVLQERLRNASELESMVQSHHRVIERIHTHQPIMPAKFGMIYAHARDIVSALRSAYEAAQQQLRKLEGCDEWAVHLYADRAVVRERVSVADPAMQRLREQRATARPGRGYFLGRQLRDDLETATRNALVNLAQRFFERLSRTAVQGQVSPAARTTDPTAQAEILRASFLVTREKAEQFAEEARAAAAESDGLRCESSGPWPPYSFAAWEEAEAT